MRLRFKPLRREDGQALVEMAFVLPLLLLFLFGIIEFGLAINRQNTNTNLANLAARTVSVIGTTTTAKCSNGTTSSSLSSWVTCEAQAAGESSTGLSTCIEGGYTAGDAVTVEVSSTFNWLSLVSGGGGVINPTSNITGSATMRVEQTATGNSFLSGQKTCSS